MKLLIIGAGISGLAAARLALNRCFDVHIMESTDRIGGMMRSEIVESQAYDIGAFTFPQGNSMFDVFPELSNAMFAGNRILKLNNIVNTGYIDIFPFTLQGLFNNSSILDLARISASYMMTFGSRDADDLRSWLVSHMGSAFYDLSGLHRYIERYYGLPDNEISMKFAKGRMGYIEDFRIENTVMNWFRKFARRTGGKCMDADTHYPLLRPRSGFEELFSVIERSLGEHGCTVSKNEMITGLRKLDESYLVTTNKRIEEAFDSVLLAAPPQSIIDSVGIDRPCNAVESFSLLSMFIKGNMLIDGDILYNSSPYGNWKRMTLFNRLYNEECEVDRFTVEVVVDSSDPHINIQEAFRDFVASGERLCILDPEVRLCGAVLTENAYPKLTIAQEKDI